MGLSWQQGPLGRDPNGRFVTASPMPERLLFAEPLRRRMSVELGGSIVLRSDDAVLLFEPGRYPVAYFPLGDAADGVLQATSHRTTHADAWSYRAPIEEMARIANLVSFEPDKVEITIDGQRLEPVPGQTVIAHGPDRNLSVDEVGGIRLPDHESPVGIRA